MPCRDWGHEEQARRETHERLDMYARLLCEAMHIIEKGRYTGKGSKMSKELAAWWKKHQEDDAQAAREAEKEKKRKEEKKAAYAKMSPRERKLLGLNPNEFSDGEDEN